MRPTNRPLNPCFSSGPCAKRPGWNLEALGAAPLGRSHRGTLGKARLAEVIERTREILQIPADYRIGIVPASDTGAVEMCMWSMLGARGVDITGWESFGKGWITDAVSQLKLEDLRVFTAEYGQLPDLVQLDADRDIVFTWNGTTSGVRVPDGGWIADDRQGLTICDATSGVFAMELPWEKLDVVTYSWQKAMGGEGAHGMLVLSPRAVQRLESYSPPWPLPKLFRMTKGGKVDEALFRGSTINTPSMLCVEDAIDGLRWAESIGGLAELVRRSQVNLECLSAWVESSTWASFLAEDEATRSSTSICLKFVDPWYESLPADAQRAKENALVGLLEEEGVAYDIGSYRDAPPGLRIWGGSTVERSDIEALLPWLDWAWSEIQRAG
ncbi:MAG: phosphoserine transaminase [Candidatus Latescibacterota bacterium]|mgnify:FL=1|nr:phosphoserine transaminase [Candidatus Latescibacterota bacterium]MEE2726229.1 phosphoserine transaminase [Candidatus Latescibacterota bacterium]